MVQLKLFTKDYYYTLFVLRIVTWSSSCSLRIIIISYLKPYKCEQTNGSNQMEIITLNHIVISIR